MPETKKGQNDKENEAGERREPRMTRKTRERESSIRSVDRYRARLTVIKSTIVR